jgi:hypothetical protein
MRMEKDKDGRWVNIDLVAQARYEKDGSLTVTLVGGMESTFIDPEQVKRIATILGIDPPKQPD